MNGGGSNAAQGELDLGLAKPERRHRLAQPPQDLALFNSMTAAGGPTRSHGSVDTAESARVVSTSSALLFDLLAGVYDSLGLSALGDEMFRDPRTDDPPDPVGSRVGSYRDQ